MIADWPPRTGQADGGDVIARGILKANVLTLGDNFPDEVDPRVMILFTTRDEPVSHAQIAIDFRRDDGSIAEYGPAAELLPDTWNLP